MKKIAMIMGTALLITALTVPAFAQERGRGRNTTPRGTMRGEFQGRNLTDEQRLQMQELRREFLDNTSGTRDEIAKKSIDLRSALRGSEPDARKAKAIQKEISDLSAKLAEARIDHMIEAGKICPDCSLGGRGMMRAGKGFGNGPFGY